ncbi:histidine kinase [Phenylobacterium sp.]|uniref:sensor histidine kinase n=1 Tax=Phenylobacterium sp. TaxID=1871053 RepID=UPI00286C6D42|nr:histidine kinase [Phenylobacterium sp.]
MRRLLGLFLLLTVWWSAVAAVYAEALLPMARRAQPELDLGAVLIANWAGWLVWAPVSLFCILAVSRHPMERGRIGPGLLTACGCLIVAIVARAVSVAVSNDIVPLWYETTPDFWVVLRDSARNNFLLAGLVVGAAHAVHYARAHAQSRERIAQLESGLAQARLDTLSAQLNPHFLFNALNTIAETVHHDPEVADAMIVSLSSLLRQSLDRSGEHLIPLGDELQLLDHYLTLQRLRLGARMSTQITVADGCGDLLTPRLLLQPLAENAIVHGIGRRIAGGRMNLEIDNAEGQLRILMTSDGPLTGSPDKAAGIGLENVRQRLATLFGEQGRLRIESVEGDRTQVRVTHPSIRATPARETPA